MPLLLLLAALILPPEARPISTGHAAAVLTLGATADVLSTEWALGRGNTRELLLGRTTGQRLALNAIYVAGSAVLVHRISRRDPKAGRRALVALTIAKAALSVWNVRQGLRAR